MADTELKITITASGSEASEALDSLSQKLTLVTKSADDTTKGSEAAGEALTEVGKHAEESAPLLIKFADNLERLSFKAWGIQQLGGMVKELGEQFMGDAPEFEQWTQQFQVFLGSADAAKQRLAELAQFGTTVPFQLPQVVQADKTLVAFGLDVQDTAKKFGVSGQQIRQTIADAAAGSGNDMTRIADDFGRFAGGMSGMAIQDFEQMGITTRQQLTEMGLQFDKAGTLLTPVDQAFKVLEQTVRDRFGGMTAAESTTFSGMMTNIMDSLNKIKREMTQPIFQAVTAEAKKFEDALADPKSAENITKLGSMFAQWAGSILPPLGSLIGSIMKNFTDAGSAIEGFVTSTKGAQAVVSDFAGGVTGASGKVVDFSDLIGKAIVIWGGYELIIKAVSVATENWGKITAATTTIVEALTPAMEALGVAIGLVRDGESAAAAAGLLMDAAWAASPVGVIVAIGAAVVGLGLGVKALYDNFKPFHDIVNTVWDQLSHNPFSLVSGAVQGLMSPLDNLGKSLAGIISLIPGMGDKVKAFEATMSSLGTTVSNTANEKMGQLGQAVGAVNSQIGTTVAGWGKAAEAMAKSAVSTDKDTASTKANTQAKQENTQAINNEADAQKKWQDLIKQTSDAVKKEADDEKTAAQQTLDAANKAIDAKAQADQRAIAQEQTNYDRGMDAQIQSRQRKQQADQKALSREQENADAALNDEKTKYDDNIDSEIQKRNDKRDASIAADEAEKQSTLDSLDARMQADKDAYKAEQESESNKMKQLEEDTKAAEQAYENQANAEIDSINRAKQAFDDSISDQLNQLKKVDQAKMDAIDAQANPQIAALEAQKNKLDQDATWKKQEEDIKKRAGDSAEAMLKAYHDALENNDIPLAENLADQLRQVDQQTKDLMDQDELDRQKTSLDNQIKAIQDSVAAQKKGIQQQEQDQTDALNRQKRNYDENAQYQIQSIQRGVTAFKQGEEAKLQAAKDASAKKLQTDKDELDKEQENMDAAKKAIEAFYKNKEAQEKADAKNDTDALTAAKKTFDEDFTHRKLQLKQYYDDQKTKIDNTAQDDIDKLNDAKTKADDAYKKRTQDSQDWAKSAKQDAQDTHDKTVASIDAIEADHQAKLTAMGNDWDTWKTKALTSIAQVQAAMNAYIGAQAAARQTLQQAIGKGQQYDGGGSGGTGPMGGNPGSPPPDNSVLGNQVVASAESWEDSYAYGSGSTTFCERFVANMEGRPVQSTAYAAYQKRSSAGQIQLGGTPPPGAEVFFAPGPSNEGMGHVGISLGNGMFESVTVDGIKDYSISDWSSHSWGAPFLGWVPAGTPMLASGGQILSDGLAYLHADEFVVSQATSRKLGGAGLSYNDLESHLNDLVSGSGSGGGMNVSIVVTGNNFGNQDPRAIAKAISDEVSRELGNKMRRQGLRYRGTTIPG